jgi:hypothetical protein
MNIHTTSGWSQFEGMTLSSSPTCLGEDEGACGISVASMTCGGHLHGKVCCAHWHSHQVFFVGPSSQKFQPLLIRAVSREGVWQKRYDTQGYTGRHGAEELVVLPQQDL